jgi:hypothetical protein
MGPFVTSAHIEAGTSTTPLRPPPAENRRLKGGGLAVGAAGGVALGAIVNQATSASSLTLQQLALTIGAGAIAANVIAAGAILLRAGFGSVRAGRRGPGRVLALQLMAANLAAPALVWVILRDDAVMEKRLAAAGWEIWPDLLSLAIALLAWRLWRRSRRHEAISADEALALDARPPVLYLRSFRDDGVMVSEGGALARWVLRASRAGSDEETVAKILARIGPVIAVGKPGEPLPELGAARLYVAHDQWQRRVLELMEQARLIVVRVGSSPGVLWEIEQALARVPRQRLVLAVLGDAAADSPSVARLGDLLGESVAAALPEARVPTWRTLIQDQSHRRIGGLIWFTPDGRMQTTAVQRRRQSNWDPRHLIGRTRLQGALEQAWSDVLANLGLADNGARRRSRLTAVMLAIFVGAFGAHWFYLGNRRRGWVYVAALPLLMASLFISYVDAIRFILADAQEFESRYTPRTAEPDRAALSAQ